MQSIFSWFFVAVVRRPTVRSYSFLFRFKLEQTRFFVQTDKTKTYGHNSTTSHERKVTVAFSIAKSSGSFNKILRFATKLLLSI